MGAPGIESGWSKKGEGGARQGGPLPRPRSPQSPHPCHWSRSIALVASLGLGPSEPAFILLQPQDRGVGVHMVCWWIRPLLPAGEASGALCRGLGQGGGRVGVSGEQDGLGWPRNSLHAVQGVEETRKPAHSLFCSSWQEVGRLSGPARSVQGGGLR